MAFAAGDGVVVGPAVNGVVTIATEERIGAAFAQDRILAVAALGNVVAVAADDRVVRLVAGEEVVAVAADDRVLRVAAVETVVQLFAEQRVFLVIAVEQVIAVTTDQLVLAVAAEDQVVTLLAIDRFGIVAAIDRVLAVAARKGVVEDDIWMKESIATLQRHDVVATQRVADIPDLREVVEAEIYRVALLGEDRLDQVDVGVATIIRVAPEIALATRPGDRDIGDVIEIEI